ncbi:hypothetical protein [Shinella sp.]|jgi:hypothetical protein|uniref:hypothetical protein n=1 Tax=Shinella sp. TaxID=1870904 RepID=UPI003D2D8875
MAKWIVLAVGLLLMANGFYTRTYDFPNETPVRYCFNMDYVGIDGCFHKAAVPTLMALVPFLIGVGLVIWSIFRAMGSSRQRSDAR